MTAEPALTDEPSPVQAEAPPEEAKAEEPAAEDAKAEEPQAEEPKKGPRPLPPGPGHHRGTSASDALW